MDVDNRGLPSQVDEPGDDQETAAEPDVKKEKKVYTWICQYCNLPFDTENYSQRYCNATHKKYAQRQRKREREAQLEL